MRRCLIAALAALAATFSALAYFDGGFAGTAGFASVAPASPIGDPGVATAIVVPHDRDTPGSPRKYRASAAPGSRTPRAVPFRRIPRGTAGSADLFLSLSALSARDAVSAAAPRLLAPPLIDNFAGLVDDQTIIPPDTMGTVGPNHLVSLLNSQYRVFSKSTGSPLQTSSIDDFWTFAGGPTWGNRPPPNLDVFPYDPHTLYNQYIGRFVAISVAGRSSAESWLLVALSNGSDPTTGWTRWAIPAADNASVSPTGTAACADFPMLGIDNGAVYVAANMFSDSDVFQYSKIWVVPTDNLLAGGPALTVTTFRPTGPPGSGHLLYSDTFQPAHSFGTTSAEHLVFEGNGSNLRIARITWSAPNYSLSSSSSAAISPSYTPTSFLPNAPQLGDARGIDTSDTRLLGAVYRNGFLWTTHTVFSSLNLSDPNGRTVAAWYKIDPVAPAVVMQGRVSDPALWYYYPSIAVNADDDAAMGFSGSSSGEYAGGYYTVRKASDTPGIMQPVGLLKSGEAPYFKDFNRGSNRWGDFSATVVDPSDNVTFWTLQEYAESPFPDGTSKWATWWGKFQAPLIASPGNIAAVASSSPLQVSLTWDYGADVIDGFRIERKTGSSGAFASITPSPLDNASRSHVDNTGLSLGTTYYYRVQAFRNVNVSYSGEVSASIPAPPSGGGGGGGGCTVVRTRDDLSDGQIVVILLPWAVPAAWLVRRRYLRWRSGRSTGIGIASSG